MSLACSATLWLTSWTNESSPFLLHLPWQYMETLPVKTLDELFSNPATCLAVFRFPPYPPSPPPPPLSHLLTPRIPCCSSSHRVSLRNISLSNFQIPARACQDVHFPASLHRHKQNGNPGGPHYHLLVSSHCQGVILPSLFNPLGQSCHFSFQPRSPLTVPWISPSRRCRPSRSAILPQGISNSTLPSGKTSRMP